MSTVHLATLNRLLDTLKEMSDVVAIAAYGSTATKAWSPESDLDLIVIFEGEVPVNSLHFFVDGIPVDINLKSREGWASGKRGWLPPSGIEALWDPADLLKSVPPSPKSVDDAEQYRYAHRHRLLKLQRWIREDPDIADLMAAGATHWIAVSYFHARGMRFPGIDQAVQYWRSHDPRLTELLIDGVKQREGRLARIAEACEIALSPVGGLWSPGEVHVTGWNGVPTENEIREARRLLAPILPPVPVDEG